MADRYVNDPLGQVLKLEHCTYNMHREDGTISAIVPSLRIRVEDPVLSRVINICVDLLKRGEANRLHVELNRFLGRIDLMVAQQEVENPRMDTE